MRILLLTLMILGLSACTGLPAPTPVKQTLHMLDALPTSPSAAAKRNVVLLVSTPQARPGYDTSQMAYTQRPHELDYFSVNRWVAPPARLLEPLLLATLDQTAAFRAVAPAANTFNGDLRLDVELMQLHQEFTTLPSRIVLSLRAQLFDLRNQRLLATRQFDETESAASDDARGGVAAANRAVQRALGRLAEFCVQESVDR